MQIKLHPFVIGNEWRVLHPCILRHRLGGAKNWRRNCTLDTWTESIVCQYDLDLSTFFPFYDQCLSDDFRWHVFTGYVTSWHRHLVFMTITSIHWCFFVTDIVRMIGCAVRVRCVGYNTNSTAFWRNKIWKIRTFRRPWRKWEHNIKMDFNCI
jgi:hypothetical protein